MLRVFVVLVLATLTLLGQATVRFVSAASGDIFIQIMGSEVSWADNEYVGHAFMCLKLHTTSGVKEDCYGFYPENQGDSFIGGPGVAHSEFSRNPSRFSRVGASVEKQIKEEQRRNILAAINDWNEVAHQLNAANCIDFVHDVAGIAGFKRPRRSMVQLPLAYVQKLDNLN